MVDRGHQLAIIGCGQTIAFVKSYGPIRHHPLQRIYMFGTHAHIILIPGYTHSLSKQNYLPNCPPNIRNMPPVRGLPLNIRTLPRLLVAAALWPPANPWYSVLGCTPTHAVTALYIYARLPLWQVDELYSVNHYLCSNVQPIMLSSFNCQ